jgi:peptide deformylase
MKCNPVKLCEIKDLKEKLEHALIHSANNGVPGTGLACPQIGIPKTMAIIRIGNYKIDLVNANISNKYDIFTFINEGCLSFPGMFKNTYRYKEVVVENNFVKPYSFIASGLLAVTIQHELDHLNNILLPDLESAI